MRKWVRQYRLQHSNAHSIIKRLKRREKMGKKESKKETKESHKKVKDHEVAPEQQFIMRNGTAVKDIHELAMLLDQISDEDFGFHVNEEKNDFANWIRDVFQEEALADGLSRTTCKKESQIYLLKHVVSKR